MRRRVDPEYVAVGDSKRRYTVSCADAYILLALVFGLVVYGSLLVWIGTSYWGASGGSLLPVISIGLARNPAIQGVYIAGIVFLLLHFIGFEVYFDDTLRLSPGPIGNAIWYIRGAATVAMYIFLISVGCVSTDTDSKPHGILCAIAIAFYFVAEGLGFAQRFPRIVREAEPLYCSMLLLEAFFIAVSIAALTCYETQGCVGGAGGAPAYEFILFSDVVIRLAWYWMDTL